MGVLLISEVKLKTYTNLNKNIDMDVLKAEIQIAQDIDLQTILGTKFYKHLLDQVQSNGTNTFNDQELILVNEYIQPYLVQTAYFNAMPQIMYRTVNRGIQQGTSESASPVDSETFKYLRSIQKQRADFYSQRLIDYLLLGRGQNQFPDYLNTSTLDGLIPDRNQKYNNGIFLRHVTRKGWDLQHISNHMPVYSEQANAWYNCPDCF